jgi:hypothetical protein
LKIVEIKAHGKSKQSKKFVVSSSGDEAIDTDFDGEFSLASKAGGQLLRAEKGVHLKLAELECVVVSDQWFVDGLITISHRLPPP